MPRPTSNRELIALISRGSLALGGMNFSACDTGSTSGTDTADASTTDGSSSDGSSTTASCTKDTSAAANDAAILAAASAFKSSLTAAQQTTVQLDYNLTNARQWSNLPTTAVKRNGVALIDMDANAQSKAIALATAAASAAGSTLLSELRLADQYLVTNGGASATDYGQGRYYFAFVGTPSATSPWMLQVAGHHLAYNFSFNTKCTSATPLFDAVEPLTWTDTASHAPLETQRAAMTALLGSISSLPGAQLSGTYTDIISGPAGMTGDSKFPNISYPTGSTARGVAGSALSAAQRTLLKQAIEAWVKLSGDPVSTSLLASYESDSALDATYVGFTGSTDLTTQASYARIDGPRVFIEFTVQGGIVYRNKVHYHTIWRDKVADYGAEFQ